MNKDDEAVNRQRCTRLEDGVRVEVTRTHYPFDAPPDLEQRAKLAAGIEQFRRMLEAKAPRLPESQKLAAGIEQFRRMLEAKAPRLPESQKLIGVLDYLQLQESVRAARC